MSGFAAADERERQRDASILESDPLSNIEILPSLTLSLRA